MANSPCMCGDPYCPSCGDPYAAALEDKCNDVCDTISELCQTAYEFDLLLVVGSMAVHAHREACVQQLNDIRAGDHEFMDWQKDRIELLERRLKKLGGNLGDWQYGVDDVD